MFFFFYLEVLCVSNVCILLSFHQRTALWKTEMFSKCFMMKVLCCIHPSVVVVATAGQQEVDASCGHWSRGKASTGRVTTSSQGHTFQKIFNYIYKHLAHRNTLRTLQSLPKPCPLWNLLQRTSCLTSAAFSFNYNYATVSFTLAFCYFKFLASALLHLGLS